MQGRAQVLQDEVTHVGTHPAVPQFSLSGFWDKGKESETNQELGGKMWDQRNRMTQHVSSIFAETAFVCVDKHTIVCTCE